MTWEDLSQRLDALHETIATHGPAPLGQTFFDACAAEATAILEQAEDAKQAQQAIERITAIFDEIGVDAQRLLSAGQRRPLAVD